MNEKECYKIKTLSLSPFVFLSPPLSVSVSQTAIEKDYQSKVLYQYILLHLLLSIVK